MINPLDLSGRTILITGASSGIGTRSAISKACSPTPSKSGSGFSSKRKIDIIIFLSFRPDRLQARAFFVPILCLFQSGSQFLGGPLGPLAGLVWCFDWRSQTSDGCGRHGLHVVLDGLDGREPASPENPAFKPDSPAATLAPPEYRG